MTPPRTTDVPLPGSPLLTIAQARECLGSGTRFIRRLITERRIAYVKVGKYSVRPADSAPAATAGSR